MFAEYYDRFGIAKPAVLDVGAPPRDSDPQELFLVPKEYFLL
jgi:hypothetical protein